MLGVLVGAAFGVGGAIFQTDAAQPARQPRHHRGEHRRERRARCSSIVTLDQRGAWVSVAAVVGALLAALLVRSQAGPSGGTRLVLSGWG